MNNRTLIWALLIVGLVLVGYGHVAWMASHSQNPNKVSLLQFPLIPGYSALIMGWTGWLIERLSDQIRARESR